jgi:hypothetical protein
MPIDGAVVNRSSFIRNTSEDFSGVIGSAWDSPGSCTITNCILLGNNVGADPIDFAAEEGKSADSNWFGSTAGNYKANPGCLFANAWNYINFTRAIDNATGQYAFGAELWLYNRTSVEATAVATENYTLPVIRLAGFTEGAEISTGGALVLSQAGYVSAAFTPMLNTTSYTVGFVYPGITGIGDQLTFNRTIRVNVGEGQNLTYNRTAPKTESVQALENGEAVPNAVLAGKTLTISIGDQNHTFTLAGDGSFLMDLGNVTPGTHEIALFVPGFAPSVTEIVGAKLFTPISITALASVFVGEEVLITVTLNENATGNVTLNVRNETAYNESFNATIHDGNAALSIDGLAAGTYTVNATYAGDDNFLPNTTITTFAVLPLAPYAVSVSADPAGGGTVSGTGNYTPGSTVTVTAQPQTGYDFVSWTESGAVVSENAIYAFTAEKARELVAGFVKKTFLISFLNYDGTGLLNATVAYGETPQYTGQTPVKPATDAKTYAFTGWEPAITAVTGPKNYTAVFSEADATYTIRFLNYDGSELLNATVAYGQTPQYTGQTPVKPEDAQYTYSFSAWSPEIVPVNGSATYTAAFNATAKTPQYYDWTPPAETRFDVVYTDNGGSLSNFERVRTYNDGIFTDVDPEGWYYENVAAAYEFSLMDGTADEIFGVGKYLKLSETLALACRLHNIYYGGSGSFDQTKDKAWYTVYEDYAVRYGIIVRGQYDLTENATRAQFAEIISAALPEEALKAINDVKTLPDMDAGDPRLPAVLQLYNAGILTGTDDKGTFRPDALILREQAAAMMTRVSDPELRQTFVLAPDLP